MSEEPLFPGPRPRGSRSSSGSSSPSGLPRTLHYTRLAIVSDRFCSGNPIPKLFSRRGPPGKTNWHTSRDLLIHTSWYPQAHPSLFSNHVHPSPYSTTMQIRTGNNIFKYRCPSRPLSPASLSCSPKGMPPARNELGGIENQTAELWQPERGPHLQQPRQQQPQSSASPPPFPPELIDHIVDHLHDDKQSLVQCSMTSGVFSRAAGYHLFRTVSVPSVRWCVQFQELIQSSSYPISSTSSSPLSPPLLPYPQADDPNIRRP
jgi:hypothetical protein